MTLTALHLVVLLAVMAPQLPAMTVLQSTTGQPPSLPSPHQSQATTMMTPSSSSSLTSIKLMAIKSGSSGSSGTTSSRSAANQNNYSNRRSPSLRDQSPVVATAAVAVPPAATIPMVNDESVEGSTAASGRNATVIGMARGRSLGSGSVQNESQRRSYQRYRLPSPSSANVQQVQQQQQQQQNHFRRQTEPSAGQPIEHQTQTTKTPRMIQRLVGGHIQNAPSTVSTTPRPSTASLFRRKPFSPNSSIRSPKVSFSQPVATTTKQPEVVDAEDREDDDDAAFLDDPADFDNWDNGILRLSAGSGKESSAKGKKKDDSKKTLSDQVRDGKYGLIEKELFRRAPKRPGVLSYLPNKEVPIDNERNYGGLNEEDIWLAEDHLLVIKGGSLNEQEPAEPWPPLDDYDAPGRQIKIPPNPKVPPPFPVQLEENGPIQFIGDSKKSLVYPIANESIYPSGQAASGDASDPGRDNEKNLLTRPGTAGGAEKGQNDPSYFYPKPYPPWLFHNQSFVNPFLSARPISFPGIGPFLNGSLGDFNSTDFDEDDPSLYYPPPYSFVYKSNYSNPVPPGPLVPGIVLPPPPDAFARLEKPKPKYQVPTTTTTTTTELPFREILTKITEYTPQTINVNKPKTGRPSSTSGPKLQPIPVQKEVYYTPSPSLPPPPPSKAYSTPNPNLISFVPTTVRQSNRPPPTLSKSNPIYYEYYEARKEPPTTQNYEFLSQQAPQYKPPKDYSNAKVVNNAQYYYSTTERAPPKQQFKSTNRPQFVYQDYVYITPKPEIRPNGVSNTNQNYIPYQPPVKTPQLKNNRPYESFEREVNAIRDTLRFYQSQQLQDNSIPRTPKAKPVYDYQFEATKPTSRNFSPPPEYDAEPFKPMVTYSPPVDDANSFRAIAFEKVDNDLPAVPSYYEAPSPVQQEPDLQPRPRKKIRVGAKYLQPIATPYEQEQPRGEGPLDYAQSQVTTPRTVLTTAKPWITVEKQVVQEVPAPTKSARLQVLNNRGYPGQFQGYYYNPPNRQNNRFYEEPFYQQPTPPRKVITRRPAARPQQQQVWSLENDTYVNYAPNRPPLNPDSEFINPYQPFNQYSPQQFSQAQRLPPSAAIQNQNPYYTPPPNRVPPSRQQQQQPISLHRDTLVNYRQPLPPINPNSEFVNIPSRTQSQPHQQQLQQLPLPSFRTPSPVQYRNPPQGGGGGAGAGSVYVITPQFRRHNNGGAGDQ